MAVNNCFNYLGKSGLKVSPLCLGTMTFGQSTEGKPGQLAEKDAHAVLDRYFELGGNFIDTANTYGDGLSESIIGTWLPKQNRDKVVLATKVFWNMDSSNPNASGLGRKHIVESVEKSLGRLNTSYVDLLQMHCFDAGTPLEETIRTLSDLVRSGKVRHIGASNFSGWQLQKFCCLANYMGLENIVSVQNQYSLLVRQCEYEVTDVCANEGIGLLPWSPLKGGFLSGKLTKQTTVETVDANTRVGWVSGNTGSRQSQSHSSLQQLGGQEQTWAVIDTATEIAKAHGATVPQVAIRWLLQKSYVPSVVIGCTKLAQLEDNMNCLSWELTPQEMSRLDEVSAPEIPYPYEMVRRLNTQRLRHNNLCK